MKWKRFACTLAALAWATFTSAGLAETSLYERSSRDGLRELRRGNYPDAVRNLEAAARAAQSFGEGDARHSEASASLAQAYFAQGRYREAEVYYRRALAATEKRLPPEHPEVATAVSNLAELYRYLGRTEEAAPLHRRALRIRESNYGTEHLSVAESLYYLAEVLRAQRRYAEAERLYWRSVMVRSYLQGRDSPALWPSLNGLAEVNRALGRASEAGELYRRATALAEKALPAARLRTPLQDFALGDTEMIATSRGNSASLQLMPVRPLSDRERLLAAEHPDLARQLEGLADVYAAQGRFAAALELVRRVLSMREGALGAQHPEVAEAYGSLARVLAALGQRDGALTAARAATRQLSRQAEKRRWRDNFVLHVALLADRAGADRAALAESFYTVQQLARLPYALELFEAQKLIRPGETLLATLATDEAVYAWVVHSRDAVFLQDEADEKLRVRLTPLLEGSKRVLFVAHGERQALRPALLAKSHALTVLPAVGYLAERPPR